MMFGFFPDVRAPVLTFAACATASAPRETDVAAATPLFTRKSLRFIFLISPVSYADVAQFLEEEFKARLEFTRSVRIVARGTDGGEGVGRSEVQAPRLGEVWGVGQVEALGAELEVA